MALASRACPPSMRARWPCSGRGDYTTEGPLDARRPGRRRLVGLLARAPAAASSTRCRRCPTCSPACARATPRSAPAARSTDDALGEVMPEANTLAGTLREQRLGALEATALLRKVMEEIDVAVFTFDGAHRLRLVNRAGERLLGRRRRAAAEQHRRASWASTPASTRRVAARRRTWRFPAASGGGRSGAAASARAASPTTCWC